MKLGQPIPSDTHAVSVSLPQWEHVKGYEEGVPSVINAMQLGYPRFVYHPFIKQLSALLEKEFASEAEFCLPFPSEKYALMCVKYCAVTGLVGKVREYKGIYAVILPKGAERSAKEFWMHTGYIVSSRLAEHILANKPHKTEKNNLDVQEKIIWKLAGLADAKVNDIYLFPTGMAAIFTAFEIAGKGEGKTIQLGFPYVDTLKIQQKFGNAVFVDYDLAKFELAVKTYKPLAVFTEFPLNPLLTCVDLAEVKRICHANNAVFVVDDTLGTWANTDILKYADIAVTSLTKFFSGIGNVTAGSLILNENSPYYARLKHELANTYEDLLFEEDAKVLEQNCQDFEQRIAKINVNAEKFYEYQ